MFWLNVRVRDRMNNTVMVIGPNGVGKTKFAYDLARSQNGEVINLDRTYLYKGFPITTGLQDTLKEQGVRRHFYEVLNPNEESYSTENFVEMVLNKALQLCGDRKLVIAEGASTRYVPALLKRNETQMTFKQVIGLRFSSNYNVVEKYRSRIEDAFNSGLVDELSKSLPDYETSFLIRECHFVVPTVEYIKGRITLQQAKDQVLDRCLKYKDQQLDLFKKYDQIQWIEV